MPLHQKAFPRPLKTVAILGTGLIGGSIARALACRSPRTALRLLSTKRSFRKTRTAFPEAFVSLDPTEVVRDAKFVVLATPVGIMPTLATAIAPHLSPEAIVTDAASTKRAIVTKLEKILRKTGGTFGTYYVGSHPMAGSERSGVAAAQEALFDGATCIVTPTSHSRHTAAVERFWRLLGMRTIRCTPAQHDHLVAQISHLPHALAATLISAVSPTAFPLAGSGLRDTTRIAAGSPDMWTEILLENRVPVLDALKKFECKLSRLRTFLETSDFAKLDDFLIQAQTIRKNL